MERSTNIAPAEIAISIPELVAILIKHRNIHSGRYGLGVKFEIAVGSIGPSLEKVYPGAMIGISGVNLVPANDDAPNSVDAAVVNPKPKPDRKKK